MRLQPIERVVLYRLVSQREMTLHSRSRWDISRLGVVESTSVEESDKTRILIGPWGYRVVMGKDSTDRVEPLRFLCDKMSPRRSCPLHYRDLSNYHRQGIIL